MIIKSFCFVSSSPNSILLNNNTLFIGKVFHELEAIGSTNQYALELLTKSKPSEGTIIITPNQYAGRGQVNKYWESEPYKNLTFSLILYPRFLLAKQQFLLNQAISLGILSTLKHFIAKKCTIKWPNDLYIENRKITGILIQNSLKGKKIQSSIIGIGLNVNQAEFKSDAPNPTSIFLETGKIFDLEVVLQKLCQKLEHYYLLLRSSDYQTIRSAYEQQLFRLNEERFYKKENGTICKGMILGVTNTGLLRLATVLGEEQFSLKEIKYVL